jgi:uncharacterized protein YecE (DUF72 family)
VGSKPTSRPNHPFRDPASPPVPRKITSVESSGTAPLASRLFIGTSGWAYPTWKPGFYPATVSTKKFLSFYATQLNSVEVNYTFRELPTPEIVNRWLADTPTGFRFSFKAPQRITHFNRLLDCDALLAEFFDTLKPVAGAGKLGLVLFQLPPNFQPDLTRLRSFLDAPAFRRRNAPPIAFEFRHPGWFSDETAALLRKRNAAFCIAETDDLTTPEVHTAAAHTCFRLRRGGGYTAAEIAAFAVRFRALAADRNVYIYFRHEDEPTGALNACALRKAVA